MWSRSVSTSIEAARTAASNLEELVRLNPTERSDGSVAWGQFVDDLRDRNQTGIYGTSCAIELLREAGCDPKVGALSMALATVAAQDGAAGHPLFNDPEDPYITYKLAALAECTPPPPGSNQLRGAAETLRSHMAPNGGWAHYIGQGGMSPDPELLATAVVLYSLRRDKSFRVTTECEQSVRWLADRVSANAELPPAVTAMCVLALQQYESETSTVPQLASATAAAMKRLSRWAFRRPAAQIGEHYEFHYSIRTLDRSFNHYLFLLPDCIAMLVFLHSGAVSRSVRGYVRAVIRRISANVAASQGFKSPNSFRKSTADQLWAFRTLQAYAATPASTLKGIDYLRVARLSRRQLIVGLGLILLALGFGAVSVSKAALLVRTGGALMAAACVGVLAIIGVKATGVDE